MNNLLLCISTWVAIDETALNIKQTSVFYNNGHRHKIFKCSMVRWENGDGISHATFTEMAKLNSPSKQHIVKSTYFQGVNEISTEN